MKKIFKSKSLRIVLKYILPLCLFIFFGLSIFMPERFNSIQRASKDFYKLQQLKFFYYQLSLVNNKQDHAGLYKFLTPEERFEVSLDEFVNRFAGKRQIYSQKSTPLSYSVESDVGTVERLIIICYTQSCQNEDKLQDISSVKYKYENGHWYIPYVSNKNSESYCSKTTPYEMSSEFQRALDFVIEKYAESNVADNNLYSQYLSSIKNCINIQYDSTDSSSEGYFTFDPTRATQNSYPIFVNYKYALLDELSMSLLLSHELSHVLQFVSDESGNTPISCFEKEVQAFYNQFVFSLLFNSEEKRIMGLRVAESGNWQEDSNSQIEIFKQLLLLAQKSQIACHADSFAGECWTTTFNQEITQMVESNEYYISQCSN